MPFPPPLTQTLFGYRRIQKKNEHHVTTNIRFFNGIFIYTEGKHNNRQLIKTVLNDSLDLKEVKSDEYFAIAVPWISIRFGPVKGSDPPLVRKVSQQCKNSLLQCDCAMMTDKHINCKSSTSLCSIT